MVGKRIEDPSITFLLVEDEEPIVDMLRVGFSYEGYRVEAVGRGMEALDFLARQEVDLVILDLMFPDVDGFQVCRRIRARGLDVPILMLTARKEIEDRVRGLNLGADDYLTKPFSFDELLARVRALLRRSGKRREAVVLLSGELVLNTETREVKQGERVIHLTPTEFALLELFMRHPRRVFSKETLLHRIWGCDFVGDTNVVEVHVSRLRKKLGDKEHRLIRAVYGVGYALYPEE